MPFPDPKQPASFSIYRLAEVPTLNGAHSSEHDMIEIYLVINGRAAIPGKEYGILLENNTLYCSTWSKHYHPAIKEGSEGYFIRFNKTLLYSGTQEYSFPDFYTLALRAEVLPVNASFLESGEKLCELMRHEYRNQCDGDSQILVAFLSIFLLHIMRQWITPVGKTGNGTKHALVYKFHLLLEQKFKTNKKVSDYAALLFVTPNHLNAIIKQVTGNPASYHIRQRIVLEAVRQARFSGASMKEVAWDLGFQDNAHFSKLFKKMAGTNFSDIRKSYFSNSY